MRTSTLAIVIAFISTVALAQEKANLTKDETIKYLNENMFHPVTNINSDYTKNSIISFEKNKIQFEEKREYKYDYNEDEHNYNYELRYRKYVFQPSKIVDIKITESQNTGILFVNISFLDKSAIEYYVDRDKHRVPENGKYVYVLSTINDGNNSVQEIFLAFDSTDPDNSKRVKKALLYLAELCKAEGDPFD